MAGRHTPGQALQETGAAAGMVPLLYCFVARIHYMHEKVWKEEKCRGGETHAVCHKKDKS